MLLAALLLTAFFGLALGSAGEHSPVTPEPGHIARGWAVLRTRTLLPADHPLLGDVLAGLPLLLEPDLPAPDALPGWAEADADRLGASLVWQAAPNVERLLLLVRVVRVWLALLLLAVLRRWARDLYGRWGAALTLTGLAFSPSLLAAAPLATPHMPALLFFIGALAAWSAFARYGHPVSLLIAGGCTGLALATATGALLLPAALGLTALWLAFGIRRGGAFMPRWLNRVRRWPLGWVWPVLAALAAVAVVAAVMVLAVYAFAGAPPAPQTYLDEFTRYVERSTAARHYLAGQFSESGWWYAPLALLAAKLPVPFMLLVLLAALLAATRRVKPFEWLAIVPMMVIVGGALVPSEPPAVLDMLPVVALLYLYIGRVGVRPLPSGWGLVTVVGVLAAGLAAATVITYPHYLGFFNLPARAAADPMRIAAGPNLDWGQDLPALGEALSARGGAPVYLSVAGSADPAYYGISYTPLPGQPGVPPAAFYPLRPGPGLYALSTDHVVGVDPALGDTYGYFRGLAPQAHIGASIRLYEVPVLPVSQGDGLPWVARCDNPDMAALAAAFDVLAGVEAVAETVFDCETSLAFPEGAGWLLLPARVEPVAPLAPADFVGRGADGLPAHRAWIAPAIPQPPATSVDFPSVALPLPIAGRIELLGYELAEPTPAPGGTLTLTTWWRVREPPAADVSLLVELGSGDQVIATADALGVPGEAWARGLVFLQQHTIELPASAPPGSYPLTVRLWQPETGFRYPVFESGDREVTGITLRLVEVGGR